MNLRESWGIMNLRESWGIMNLRESCGIMNLRESWGIMNLRESCGIMNLRDYWVALSREWENETIHGYDGDETSLIPYFSGQPDCESKGILGNNLGHLETNELRLTMDGWNATFLLGSPIFRRELLILGSATCARTLSSNRMEECWGSFT